MSFSKNETASSTFQVSVWSLGMQHETKGSWELFRNDCIFFFYLHIFDIRRGMYSLSNTMSVSLISDSINDQNTMQRIM